MRNSDKELERNGSGYRDPTASPVLQAIYKRELSGNAADRADQRLVTDL